jgi:hypothetical protein
LAAVSQSLRQRRSKSKTNHPDFGNPLNRWREQERPKHGRFHLKRVVAKVETGFAETTRST